MAMSISIDVMLMIFEQLVRVKDAEERWPAMVYDHRAAQAPFTVASVCRRWRGLALTMPTLWTYFGFPPPYEEDERRLQRLNLLRRRAGNAPIDVVFGWDSRLQTDECTSEISLAIFNTILGLNLRWKTAVLHVVGSAECGWTVDQAFQCSEWPVLETLALAVDDGRHALPAAPRLRRIWLDCHRNSIEEPLARGYPTLTLLCIHCDSVSILRELAQNVGSHLVELVLLDDSDGFVDELGPDSTLGVFPTLQSLAVDDARWLGHIEAPALKKLLLTTRYIKRVEQGALSRLSHVRDLQLCGSFKTSELAVLENLSNISTLIFDSPPTLITAFAYRQELRQINLLALRDLASFEPPIWPHLARLHFGATLYLGRKPDEAAQDLVDFVAARNTRFSTSDEPAVARIVEVVVRLPGAPDWLEKTLRELTAS